MQQAAVLQRQEEAFQHAHTVVGIAANMDFAVPHTLCNTCKGKGTGDWSCNTCSGTGKITQNKTCTTCDGNKTVEIAKTCTTCNGDKKVEVSHNCTHSSMTPHYECK